MKALKTIENYFKQINEISTVYLLSDEIERAIQDGYIQDTKENTDLIDQVQKYRELAKSKGLDFHYISCRIAEKMNPEITNTPVPR